jgi:hypothetical protein
MRSNVIAWLIVIGATVALPLIAYAQEAAVLGTVTDSTGGVLPGVTIRIVHEASGNSFDGVTDERGTFRLPARLGIHQVTAELQGFASITRSVDLLAGQQAVVNLQLLPSSVQETVTVTGETPLIDVTQSTLSGNIDPRQMQELPVNGRNWIDLSLLAPGMRINAVTDQPVEGTNANYQINIDGQQVTNDYGANSFGSPKFSRDAIAEFEFVASRFSAVQGRSAGVQVNAVTKSGTNTPAGSFAGYFRHDKFNAADFIEKRVLPYSDQQLSATFGGPILRDKLHFFVNYEYEREPQTYTYSSPWPEFNIDQSGTREEHKGGVRLDWQLASQSRLMMRANKHSLFQPLDPDFTGGAERHPSSAQSSSQRMDEVFLTLTQVLSNRALNEVRAGYAGFAWDNTPVVTWAGHPQPGPSRNFGAPIITLNGYRLGHGQATAPQHVGYGNYTVRDDLTYSFRKGGRHDIRTGGEFLYSPHFVDSCRNCVGTLDARGGPIPANIVELIPVWNDPTTWNIAAFSSISRRYNIGVGNFDVNAPRKAYAAWVQDDWAVTPRLTLNLGLRYDLQTGIFANWLAIPPFLEAGRPDDTDNFGPRAGFAYSLNDRTVLRGGTGIYVGDTPSQTGHWTVAWSQIANTEVLNDGRPNFASNPFNGPLPTFEQVIRSGRRDVSNFAAPDMQNPYSYQSSIGVQRQLGAAMAFEADYVWVASRAELFTRNINLAYNPSTGVNYPFTNVNTRPYPNWGSVGMYRAHGKSNNHALQTAFTKRFSNRWQASATYLLQGDWEFDPVPLNPGCRHPIQPSGACDVPIQLAPDIAENKYYLTGDQRHRAVLNGIWQAGSGFQVSGLYLYGDNGKATPNSGADVRITGGAAGRLRRNGTLIARNSLDRASLHRVDMRIQRRFPLGGRAAIDGILEVFNLFNHENYGSYVLAETNQRFGQPNFNNNVAYSPRLLQLGFRATF